MKRGLVVIWIAIAGLGMSLAGQRASVRVGSSLDATLFRFDRIGTVQLEFTEVDYKALAPQVGGWFNGSGSGQSWLQGPDGKRNGFAASRGVQFAYVHGSATIDGQTVRNIGVRYKGNGTYFDGAAQGK